MNSHDKPKLRYVNASHIFGVPTMNDTGRVSDDYRSVFDFHMAVIVLYGIPFINNNDVSHVAFGMFRSFIFGRRKLDSGKEQ